MKLIHYSCFVFLVFLFACNKEVKVDVLQKELSEFDTLILNSVFDVELVQDTLNAVEIKAHPTLLSHLLLEQKSGNLTLGNTYKGKFLMPRQNKIMVKLHTNGLSKIIVNQSCFVHNSQPLLGKEIGLVVAGKLNEADLVLNCETFYYWNNFPCGGTIKLAGTSKYLKLWNVALMAIDARNLATQYALVENRSKGDCSVNCSQQLTCKIDGEGSIYYWGRPAAILLTENYGKGQLVKSE